MGESKVEEDMQQLRDCLRKGKNCKPTNVWVKEKKKKMLNVISHKNVVLFSFLYRPMMRLQNK